MLAHQSVREVTASQLRKEVGREQVGFPFGNTVKSQEAEAASQIMISAPAKAVQRTTT